MSEGRSPQPVFCPKCKSLKQRTMVRGRPVDYCAQCEGKGSPTKPVPWFAQGGGLGKDSRSRDAAKAAAGARPHVPASTRSRARADTLDAPRRQREPLPPPDKVQLPPGMDLFPFGNVRDGQREFIADVAEAVQARKHLLAHAPTGLGKTVSTLAPLVAYALAHGKRVFFLTSKQSQHKIAVDTLKAIREKAGVPFAVADVIGKQDMCPRREARELFPKKFSDFCRREQVSHQCDYWEQPNTGAVKALKLRVHSVEELVMTCTDHTTCPHNTALDLAAQAHVVVCDYNYFFSDMREQMQERLKLDLKDVILVVDEAHNLPDRIRDHLSLELGSYLIGEAMDEANVANDAALSNQLQTLETVLQDLAEAKPSVDEAMFEERRASSSERFVSRAEFVDAVNAALGSKTSTLVHTDYEGLLEGAKEAAARFEKDSKSEAKALVELVEFLTNWKFERRGSARILNTDGVPRLAYKILDPAVLAKPVFDAVHSSVVMSGTLHPMEMTRDVLGIDPARAVLREYRSPFPRENRLVLIDAAVTTGTSPRSSRATPSWSRCGPTWRTRSRGARRSSWRSAASTRARRRPSSAACGARRRRTPC
jgi:DNA excision repair protein ERCC-2